MIEFKILKKSKRSSARLGVIKTPHGEVETPALIAVATQATIKGLKSEDVVKTKTQALIVNTFHLHLKPGEEIVKNNGGLHKFMNWRRPLMTDSGGFQVFSLGFGKDFGISKAFEENDSTKVKFGQQPKLIKITDFGVSFTSPLDGKKLFLGPKESIKIQEKLGADIIFAFDECPPPTAEKKYVADSMTKTHKWAKISLKEKKTKQAIFGIIQGGRFKDLRFQSAKLISSLGFDGFGIGGEFGNDKKVMAKIIGRTNERLPFAKPRHLLGVGHPEDLPVIIKAGVDTFDCIVPTHYARHGVAFTFKGRLDIKKSVFLKDKKPIDPKCNCKVCLGYSRSYITHLFKAKELTGPQLLTFHNLFFFNSLVEKLREQIKKGKL